MLKPENQEKCTQFYSSDGRARYRNQSGVVELVEREPLVFARVENGVTKKLPEKNAKIRYI